MREASRKHGWDSGTKRNEKAEEGDIGGVKVVRQVGSEGRDVEEWNGWVDKIEVVLDYLVEYLRRAENIQ